MIREDPNIGSAVALKEDQLQLVTDVFGDIPSGNADGLGLYMRDTRYLSAFELKIDGRSPIYLSHSAERNYIATFQFVNHSLTLADGVLVPRQTISIRRSRFVDGHALHERLGFYNCNHFPVDLTVSLTVDADFLDIFAVRRFARQRRGTRSSIRFGPKAIRFSYTGRDRLGRSTVVEYDRHAESVSSNTMAFDLRLKPHEPQSITLAIRPETSMDKPARSTFDVALSNLAESYEDWHRCSTAMETDNEFFDRSLLRQSRLDVRALLEFFTVESPSGNGSHMVPSAGIPWYAVPFGRDSAITALQTLSYNPEIAVGTLYTLAHYQGTKVDEQTEEEPGKIFHEIRRGELANLREIPHLPYYGTIDATPLFIILFVETMRWLGASAAAEALYRDLLPAVLRALEWIDRYGDIDGDGYVEHRAGRSGGVTNQGWKDSFDSLQYPDGSLAKLPAALVEVQGYVYQAKSGLAGLLRGHGQTELADRLDRDASALRARLNEDYWMESESCFAQALDGDKRPVTSITSNAGHLLWSRAIDSDKAKRLVGRLMDEDLFSGWGIRTLSRSSPNYNPMSYHNGSVWPHDNSIIAAGMRYYGHDAEAAEVITHMINAGLRFPSNRLPELFCGFPRDRRFNSSPAAYVVSCSPQAWAAAAPFLFLQTLLDLQPVAGGLRVNPIANDLFHRYRLRHMRVGDDRLTLEVTDGDRPSIRVLEGATPLLSDVAEIQ